MSYQEWTESDIQSLKAQEAKDLAVEFLQALENKAQGPISPGEVQLRELEYELKIKEAEKEDARQQREHELQIRELELRLEQQRTEASQASSQSDAVRRELQELVERVRGSEETLSVSLERATREHRLKLEQLEQDYKERQSKLRDETEELTTRRDQLVEHIQQLTDIEVSAEHLTEAQDALVAKRDEFAQQQKQLDDEIATLEFERTKRKSEVEQKQELELTRLKHEYDKQVLILDREAADKILTGLGLTSIEKSEIERTQSELEALRGQIEREAKIDEEAVRDQIRREFNITSSESIDVTALHYKHESATEQLKRLEQRIGQLESEISKARDHIQGEPQRIAVAVEAARTPIQNIVEPASKR